MTGLSNWNLSLLDRDIPCFDQAGDETSPGWQRGAHVVGFIPDMLELVFRYAHAPAFVLANRRAAFLTPCDLHQHK